MKFWVQLRTRTQPGAKPDRVGDPVEHECATIEDFWKIFDSYPVTDTRGYVAQWADGFDIDQLNAAQPGET